VKLSRRAVGLGLPLVALGCTRGAAANRSSPRVVSTVPNMTEALFALGAGSQVVGRSRYCDYPPEALKLPVIGGYSDPSLEAILGLAPTLVVGAYGPASEALARTLQQRDIAIYFPKTDTLADIDAMIQGLGIRTSHEDEASRLILSMRGRREAIVRAVADAKKPRVMFLVGVSPVVAAGTGTFADEVLRLAGGINVVTSSGWPTLDLEKVIALDPDLILTSSMDPASKEELGEPWKSVRAVREGRVAPMGSPIVLRPGPRIAEGLAMMATALHPDRRAAIEAR
jgi:iron complex transport system substrate-binding protein